MQQDSSAARGSSAQTYLDGKRRALRRWQVVTDDVATPTRTVANRPRVGRVHFTKAASSSRPDFGSGSPGSMVADAAQRSTTIADVDTRTRMVARRAYGYRSSEALIAMVPLCCGGVTLTPPLP